MFKALFKKLFGTPLYRLTVWSMKETTLPDGTIIQEKERQAFILTKIKIKAEGHFIGKDRNDLYFELVYPDISGYEIKGID